jgi:cell division protein FtsW (lipid II flippase)
MIHIIIISGICGFILCTLILLAVLAFMIGAHDRQQKREEDWWNQQESKRRKKQRR